MKLRLLLFLAIVSLASCANGYKEIKPQTLGYNSSKESNGIVLSYKYDLLDKKYAKKEDKKDVRLVAIKIQNTTNQDVVYGKDIFLEYQNGKLVAPLEFNQTFKMLKQQPATHLLYLLLTPLQFSSSDGSGSSSTPIGLAVGPGLAGGNIIAASSANKKFKGDLMTYDLNGMVIEAGKTKYALIGIQSSSYDALQLGIK